MKPYKFLGLALLVAAVPGWADESSAPAAPPAEPAAVQATVAVVEAPAAGLDLAIDPFLGRSAVTTSTIALVCIQCVDEPSHCHGLGQAGDPCGTKGTPGSCTCQLCNGAFGCFP